MLDKRVTFYSQFGEEGILIELINKLNLTNLQICEFGMSQKVYSNTFYFIENYDSLGVYIDTESINLKTLERDNTILINTKVEKNSLDNILSTTPLKKDFDILSIDIDNEDYHVWNNLTKYEPKIVIIEINPFFSIDEKYVHDGTKFGSSFASTVELGESKGYKLVCMTGNLIFVKEHLLDSYVDSKDLYLDDAIISPDNKNSFTFKRFITKSVI